MLFETSILFLQHRIARDSKSVVAVCELDQREYCRRIRRKNGKGVHALLDRRSRINDGNAGLVSKMPRLAADRFGSFRESESHAGRNLKNVESHDFAAAQ
jgi:hypothetical protein